jgi:mannose-1-phosphate guanylyltransferase
MARLQPDILKAARAAFAAAAISPGTIALDPAAFEACPSDSVDYAIMEKTDRITMAPLDTAWNDLGSWAAIWEASEKDASGNAVSGDVLVLDAHDCLVRTDGPQVSVIETADLIVVVERGAVLVAPKAKVQKVKAIVEALRRAGRLDLI